VERVGDQDGNGARTPRRREVRSYLTSPWVWASGLLTVIILGLALLSPMGRHELVISFTRQPDSYTELYFTGPTPVSTARVAGRQQITVNFAVTNHERRLTQYAYLVRLLDSGSTSATERMGYLAVGDGETLNNNVALALPSKSRWSIADVNLVGRTEAIHYTAPDARTPGN
jgi:uncharacterized membrane protein